MTVLPISELMHPSWAEVLTPVEDTIRAIGTRLRTEQLPFLPASSQIFRAFSYPLNSVKVIILGQDPYPTPGHPVGLSFSVAPNVHPLPKSLQNIFREIENDLGIPPASNGDLSPWCNQGVMLINRVITVTPGKPASHQGYGWEEVTACALKALANRSQPLVAILWGKPAQSAEKWLGDYPKICSPHPSPLSAYRGFFGSRPFSRTNELLAKQGATPIDWRLHQ